MAAIAATAFVGMDLTLTARPAEASSSAEVEFVDRLNAERNKEGLSALVVNTSLRRVARDWSAHMADCTRNRSRARCLQHNPNYGSQVTSRVTNDWSRVGENVGYSVLTGASTGQLVRRLHQALMDSPGHRRNILGSYNQVGVGVSIARDGSLWVTQNFMQAPINDSQVAPVSEIKVDLSSAAVPISGDWNGDGRATPGWYDKGRVYLRNTHGGGGAHLSFSYGRSGDVPIVGDWNGNGQDTIGILRDGRWHLRNSLSSGAADLSFRYGRLNSGDYAIAGDWTGDGRDTVGIVRGGQWHLRYANRAGHADLAFKYGRVLKGDVPVVGDWNSDGRDTPGIVRGSEWHLRYANRAGHADHAFNYGSSGDVAVVGDWNRSGTTTPGIVRGNEWHLRNRNAGGSANESYAF